MTIQRINGFEQIKMLCIHSHPPKKGHIAILPEVGEIYTVRQKINREGKEARVIFNEFISTHYIGNKSNGLASFPISWFIEL